MKQGRLRLEQTIEDPLELADALTKFIGYINPLVEKFLDEYYLDDDLEEQPTTESQIASFD